MHPSPLVSVIIVSWNALDVVRKCLPSVVATDYPEFEIIFADNASTDGTAEWVEKYHPGVRLIRHPENWAFCKGNNKAAEHARGDILVLLNNDVEVPKDWLTPLVEHLETDTSTAVVGPVIMDYSDRTRFEYAGAAGGFLDRLGYPFARGRIFDTLETNHGQYDEPVPVFWVSGTCMAIRRQAWNQAGGLEEVFFMHMEEIDLCWRLARMGLGTMVIPQSRVFHMGGASLAQGAPQKTYLNFRNNLLMLHRNLTSSRWIRVFLQRLVLDGVAILRFMVTFRFSHALAILRAYAHAHSMKKDINPGPDRMPLGTRTGTHLVTPTYCKSIVFDYYLRGKKHFSDLDPTDFRED